MDEKQRMAVLRSRPWYAEELEPPEMEQIMEWEWDDGGCEAACPHGCWVEPDGWCPHGRPSWMLVLGLI
jgi:hypothetical protein